MAVCGIANTSTCAPGKTCLIALIVGVVKMTSPKNAVCKTKIF